MTALAAWIAYSDHGPTSAYLATDSRITWTKSTKWDHGKKCFASLRFPDIFGYVGEVLLPSVLLGQVCSVLDSGAIVKTATLRERQKLLADSIANAVRDYPTTPFRPFTIVHIGRGIDADDQIEFQVSVTDVDKSRQVEQSRILSHSRASVLALGGQKFVRRTEQIHVDGSGAVLVNGFREAWNATEHAHTSRTVFASVCEAITSEQDPAVGGPAQLVGLYGIGSGRNFGVLDQNGRAFVGGLPIVDEQPLSRRLPFRTINFEDVSRTGRRR